MTEERLDRKATREIQKRTYASFVTEEVENGVKCVKDGARENQGHQTPTEVIRPPRKNVIAHSQRWIVDRSKND